MCTVLVILLDFSDDFTNTSDMLHDNDDRGRYIAGLYNLCFSSKITILNKQRLRILTVGKSKFLASFLANNNSLVEKMS